MKHLYSFLIYALEDWEAVYAGHRSHKKYLGISKVNFVNLQYAIKHIWACSLRTTLEGWACSVCFFIFSLLLVSKDIMLTNSVIILLS